MADSPVSWSRSSTVFSVDPNEKLFVFGYSCKIFRDDEKAKYIDQGKHLIPWMGDKTVMIDRYDVRGYLHDLKQYEPRAESQEDPLSEEEQICDEERYRSLRSDMSEEQLYHEEELKRLQAAIAGDGAYHEIAFTYGSAENQNYEEEAYKVEEPEDELFEVPQGLNLPKDMELPYTMKIHAIIEKTANFVSQQGGQMEIIIKMKQHANPQFGFMHLDNPLHPYYKHLVKEIKSGAYKPAEIKKVSQSEDEDDDGHYLHPSLMAGKAESVPKFTVPTINFRRTSDDSYSMLVRNLQQHFVEEAPVESMMIEYENEVGNNSNGPIVSPPPNFQPIVDKMAEYVAKNGDDFETVVKSRKDKRFDFLHSWHEFYNYYIHKRDTAKAIFGGGTQDQESQKLDYKVELKKMPKDAKPSTGCKLDSLYEDDDSSMDISNSPLDDEESKESRKQGKGLKGPISFSLKSKEAEAPAEKGSATTLLMYDSEEEGNAEGSDSSSRKQQEKSWRSRSSAAEKEVKVAKQSNEVLEAKHAEERIKDKLLSTARERVAQQRKEKQLEQERLKRAEQLRKDKLMQIDTQRRERELQAERKRKAELFLKMLKKKAPDSSAVVCHVIGSDKPAGVRAGLKKRHRSKNSVSIPGIKTDWSSDSASEHSGEEEPISVIGEKLSSESEKEEELYKEPPPPKPIEEEVPRKKHSSNKLHKQRMKKYSKRSRSKSPPSRYKVDRSKEKKLPAAYALDVRSRSRSRSPRRPYKPFYNHWNRRR